MGVNDQCVGERSILLNIYLLFYYYSITLLDEYGKSVGER